MRTFFVYLKPYRWLIALALLLAAINQSFSMLDPYFFGKLMDNYGVHPFQYGDYNHKKVFTPKGARTTADFTWGVIGYLGILIAVAMVSRIAKAFQDYCGNVIVQKFGATIFPIGWNHSVQRPF